MITIDERRDLTASQLETRALDLRVEAMHTWDEWEAAGRPAERTNGTLETPLGWWALIVDAQDYERAADDARWRVAVESARWVAGWVMPPEVRPFYEAAVWEVTDGRRRSAPVMGGMSTRLPAVRVAHLPVVTS